MKNKIKFGLKNAHYAIVTEVGGVVDYAKPKAIPGAVNLVQNPSGEPVVFYADDVEYFREDVNNGYDGTLEMALIPDEFRVEVLGDTIDANGAVIENATAQAKTIALLYEFNGDAKKTRHVNYNVRVTRPNIDGSTKTNTKEPKTETMNIAVRPAIDTNDVKGKLEYGKTGYDTFYSAVYLKNAVINTADATAEHSKGGVIGLTIDVTTTPVVVPANTVKNVLLDGMPIPGVHLTVTGEDVEIAKAYMDTLQNGDYIVTVEFDKGNAVSVAVKVKA